MQNNLNDLQNQHNHSFTPLINSTIHNFVEGENPLGSPIHASGFRIFNMPVQIVESTVFYLYNVDMEVQVGPGYKDITLIFRNSN